VDVTLTYNDGGLVLNLDDDGCGFDPQQADQGNGHHFGLKGM
jgi:signal transduction histidine kinase